MKISKPHQNFADRLNNQRALSHPEEFLGPNWKELLNFWLYYETLSFEQLVIARRRYLSLDRSHIASMFDSAESAAINTTNEIISHHAYMSAPIGAVGTTWELIGVHKILEQDIPLTFVPLFLNL
jgi:hypothetical protein